MNPWQWPAEGGKGFCPQDQGEGREHGSGTTGVKSLGCGRAVGFEEALSHFGALSIGDDTRVGGHPLPHVQGAAPPGCDRSQGQHVDAGQDSQAVWASPSPRPQHLSPQQSEDRLLWGGEALLPGAGGYGSGVGGQSAPSQAGGDLTGKQGAMGDLGQAIPTLGSVLGQGQGQCQGQGQGQGQGPGTGTGLGPGQVLGQGQRLYTEEE
ncbi:unnamed protein product, partial [Discosporangium mesarthrocarpum]